MHSKNLGNHKSYEFAEKSLKKKFSLYDIKVTGVNEGNLDFADAYDMKNHFSAHLKSKWAHGSNT